MARRVLLLAMVAADAMAAVIMYDKPDVAFLACKDELQFGNPAFKCDSFKDSISAKSQAKNIPPGTIMEIVRLPPLKRRSGRYMLRLLCRFMLDSFCTCPLRL